MVKWVLNKIFFKSIAQLTKHLGSKATSVLTEWPIWSVWGKDTVSVVFWISAHQLLGRSFINKAPSNQKGSCLKKNCNIMCLKCVAFPHWGLDRSVPISLCITASPCKWFSWALWTLSSVEIFSLEVDRLRGRGREGRRKNYLTPGDLARALLLSFICVQDWC